jgi:hypothetical protein
MKWLKFLLLVLVVFEILSCKKNHASITSAKATVFDDNTQQVVPNQKIYLYEGKYAAMTDLGRNNYKIQVLKEVYTDANGVADFGEFETQNNKKYFYEITEIDGYHAGGGNINKKG